jgi:hypothetical protein
MEKYQKYLTLHLKKNPRQINYAAGHVQHFWQTICRLQCLAICLQKQTGFAMFWASNAAI